MGWSRFVPILVLIGLTLALYSALIPGDRILARGDTYAYFYPYWSARDSALRAAQLPLWTPDIFLGVPLLANSQLGTYYPPNWLTIGQPAPDAIRISILLHVVVAALGAYALARQHQPQAPPLGAIVAGLVYAGGGVVGGHIEQINQLQGMALLPWLFAWYGRWLAETSLRAWLALAGIWALQILTGHTQTVFISGVGLGIWAIVTTLAHSQASRSETLYRVGRALLGLAGAGLVALLLALPQIIPTLELTGMSNRGDGFNAQEATAFSLPPLTTARALLPSYDGQLSGEYTAYIGLIGLGLMTLGGHGRRAWPWLALAAIGLFFAYGRANPLYVALAPLPGFNLFRVPARWLVLLALGTALLAAFGVERLRTAPPSWRWRGLSWGLPGLLAGLALILPVDPGDVTGPARPTLASLLGWGVALAGLALVLVRPRLPWPILIGLVALELFASGRVMPYNDLAPRDVYTGQRFTISQLRAVQNEPASGRMLSIGNLLFDPGDKEALSQRFAQAGLNERAERNAFVAIKKQEMAAPNLTLEWGIPSADGFDGGILPTMLYSQFTSLFLPPGTLRTVDGRLGEILARPECRGACIPAERWLELMDTRYLIVDKIYDVWHEEVAYDTTLERTLTAGQVHNWRTAQGTRLDVLTVGETPVTLILDGLALPAPPAPVALSDDLWLWRWPLGAEVAPESLALRADEDPVTVRAVTMAWPERATFSQVTPEGWRRILSSDIKLYERTPATGRAWLASAAEFYPDTWQGSEAALVRLTDPSFDAHTHVILHGDGPAFTATPDLTGRVYFLAYEPTHIEIAVQTSQPAILVLADAWYPHWRATLDGDPLVLYRANVLLRGMQVPAGEHRITLTFEPQSWNNALIAGGIAWGVWGLMWFFWPFIRSRVGAERAGRG